MAETKNSVAVYAYLLIMCEAGAVPFATPSIPEVRATTFTVRMRLEAL